MANFRFISPEVYDVQNNYRLVVDNCKLSMSLSRNDVKLLGSGFSTIVEDIDDLKKTISLSGPILIQNVDEQSIPIGYIDTIKTGSENVTNPIQICDLYYWICGNDATINNIFYQYMKGISINISNQSSISIDMQTTSPFISHTDESPNIWFLKPEIAIFNTGEKYQGLNESIKVARILRNYDLYVENFSEEYISNISYKLDFSWGSVKSVPTYTSISDVITPPKTYSQTSEILYDVTPPPYLNTLNMIEITIYYDLYIRNSSEGTGRYLENTIGSYLPLDLIPKVRSKDPSVSDRYSLLRFINKWTHIEDTEWRISSMSINSTPEDIVKLTIELKSIIKINKIFGNNL
jgi:hypothetical protein